MSTSTRIRYIKDTEGNLVTTEFLGGETLLKCKVTLGDVKTVFLMKNVDGEYRAIKAVEYTDLTKAKKLVKALLKEYGVTFYEEVRNKSTGVTNETTTESCNISANQDRSNLSGSSS